MSDSAIRSLEENEAMTGIRYVTDEKGRKVAVQIDLSKHRELWEDIQDVLVSRSRWHEKRIPLDKVKAGLIKSGKLPRDWLSRRASGQRGERTASAANESRCPHRAGVSNIWRRIQRSTIPFLLGRIWTAELLA
jgi:hypothetical protein